MQLYTYPEKEINDIINQIQEFQKENCNSRNTWIGNDVIKIYIRKSKRYYNKQLLNFFDFATIEVHPDFQNKGIFSRVLHKFEELYPTTNIYVESILSTKFIEFFKKQKFDIIGDCGYKVK